MSSSSFPRHLNLDVRGLKPSATVAINDRSNALRQQGRRIYKLGLGQSPFPVPAPVVQALRDNAHQKDYLPTAGLLTLRQAVADYTRRTSGTNPSAQDVLIGPGSKELMFLLQLSCYADLILPSPSWVSYGPQARIVGRHTHWLPTTEASGWRISAQDLEDHCAADPDRPRLMILNYPSNPTGNSYSDQALKELAEVARRYNVLVLSDEIYGELYFDAQASYQSIARHYPEGTIISAGLSKWCGAGGWRLGTFVFPPELRWLHRTMVSVGSESYTSVSAPIQHAAVKAFEGGAEIEAYLDGERRILGALGRWIAGTMRAAGISVGDPQGGFYLFPSFEPLAQTMAARGIASSAQLCEALLEATGVAILPGEAFGRPKEELTTRLAFVDFDGAAALDALEEGQEPDEDWLRRWCPDVIEAIEQVCKWCQ